MSTKFLIAMSVLAIIGAAMFVAYPKFKDRRHHVDIPQFVDQAIHAYQAQGVGAFVEFNDRQNPQWVQDQGETYIFVINAMSAHLVAHGGGLRNPTGSTQALIKYMVALAKESPEGRWVVYEFINPRTGKVELKRSYIKMHDDYVFGAGEYKSRQFKRLRN